MKLPKKLISIFSLIILMITLSGCGTSKKEDSKEEEIKQKFSQTLDMYPIKNLEDLYDKEGFRDEEFDKDDKGVWVLYSEMAIEPKGGNLETRGMLLKINRNTRTATGEFVVNNISEDSKGRSNNNQKTYPIKMENNKIFPTRKINDSQLKKEIEEFKFFSQYANFKDLEKYKDGRVSYNPSAPNYSAEYNLNNDDYNVKQLRKRYDIPTKQAPKLLLKGVGDLKSSSIGSKDLEFTFVENQNENIYFSDSLEFKPSEG